MVGSGSIHLPTINHIGQSGGGVAGLPMQENHSDCSGVAQHALVLGCSGHVQPNPTEPAQSAQPFDSHSIRIEAPQRGSIRSVYEASGPFYKVMYHSSGGLRPPPCKISCSLPYVPVSGQEVAAQHH